MREVTLAAVQMESTRDKAENLKKALEFIEAAARRGAQAVLLPEAWLSGTAERARANEEFLSFAVTFGDEVTTALSESAKKNGIYLIAGGLYERDPDGYVYNTVPIFKPDGELLAKVRKTHLENAPVKAETDHGIAAGEPEFAVFDTDIGKIGVIVDIDMCALEIARIMGLKGAEILFWPLSWTSDAHDCIDLYGRAAATMMDGIVVAASHYGEMRYFTLDHFLGGSGIIDVRAYVARVADCREGVAVATVDLDRVQKRRDTIREIYPYWRRPEDYKLLCDAEAEAAVRGGKYDLSGKIAKRIER